MAASLGLGASFLAACGGAVRSPPVVYAAALDADEASGPAVPPVYMRLDAREGSELQRFSTREQDWKYVCPAPCDGYVPAFGSYRVSSPDRGLSDEFTLPGPPGTRVALRFDDDGQVWTTDSVQLSRQPGAVIVPVIIP